jgi:uncharacterized protein with HEPN domain
MPLDIDEPDRIRLIHMRDAAQQALDFSRGRERTALNTDPMYRRAAISCIQEIGEVAVRITPGPRAKIPSLPWQQIVSMRHRLVHVYFHVNLDLVWDVLTNDLAPLVLQLEQALQP